MNELEHLLTETKNVILKLAKLDFLNKFSFVGGSALTVYLSHRFSEDIDLFTWENEIDGFEIQRFINNSDFNSIRIVNMTKTQADFIIDGVKVTFFANNWNELKNRHQVIDNLYVAELETIAIMNVNTLFVRAKFRDYYDLYVLNIEKFPIYQLFDFANRKIKNLSKTLFQRAIIFTEDISDDNILHLKPKYNVTLKQIEKHFNIEIKKWNKQKNN